MEVGLRRILHCTVTHHPAAEWTNQQFGEVLVFDHPYRYVIHDRDAIFSSGLDTALKCFGVRVLKAPSAKAHLKKILREWVNHYNCGRPHTSLGPGVPEPSQVTVPASAHRHTLPAGRCVKSTPVPGGLHHEYWLEEAA